MQQYVSEAHHREKQREDKIAELMSIISANEKAAETAWKALVNEDRLLARIESLEAQLSILSNNNNPDKQKEELLKMIDEKTKFEAMTKEMVRRLIEENGETTSRLKDMERSLETTEQTYQQLKSRNEDLETALSETTEMYDTKASELEQTATDLLDKQKQLTTYEEKLTDLQQKNLKLSKSSVINETASGLSRLLATAINNGSFIDAPELHLLITTLKAASYLPPHSRDTPSSPDTSSASESELRTQLINGCKTSLEAETIDDEKEDERKQHDDRLAIEGYLKTILELQTKNRELEITVATMAENQRKLDNLNSEENDLVHDALEISPSGNSSFFPDVVKYSGFSTSSSSQMPLIQKQVTVIKKPDGLETLLLLVSLVPLLAFFLSAIAPIQKRFSNTSMRKED
uniref:HOOK domain-containing protein n=1 Tax=Caenorhabditis tropicalis TaxID=1561998 RepID=A0A1I7TD68_9PELO